MGIWGVLDISQNPIIKSIITHFLSITSPSDLFYGDTVRASILTPFCSLLFALS